MSKLADIVDTSNKYGDTMRRREFLRYSLLGLTLTWSLNSNLTLARSGKNQMAKNNDTVYPIRECRLGENGGLILDGELKQFVVCRVNVQQI